MIVVVGTPAWRAEEPPGPAGRACEIALAAAAAGARVELVGRTGDDPAGDALLIALAKASVGHAALLRDPARPTPLVLASDTDEDPFADPRPGTSGNGGAERPAGPRLEAADVALGLRYLTAFDVLIVTDEVPATVPPVALEAAAFAGARSVVLVTGGSTPGGLGQDVLVLEAPDVDDGAFAQLVGTVAAGMDRGLATAEALHSATGAGGWDPVASGD